MCTCLNTPGLADKDVPNPPITKAMRSLKSLGSVKEQLAWRHCYWYLTNEGSRDLRDDLHLAPDMVPETGSPRPRGLEGEQPARLKPGEADGHLQKSSVPPAADKKAKAQAGQQPNPSLEVDLVVDMVNYFSKVGGIILC